MKILLLITTILSVALTVSPSFAVETELHRLVGDWSGKGSVRKKGFGAEEKVQCRFKGRALASGRTSLTGRCASARGSGHFRLMISQKSGAYSATGTFAGYPGELELVGTNIKNGIELHLEDSFRANGRRLMAQILLSNSKNGALTLSQTLTDVKTGETSDAMSIEFVQ